MAAISTYEETVARLGTAIRIGVLAPGSRLPPERDLAEQLHISRSTLRQALAALTETGHLIAVRGRAGGTFVSQSPPLVSVHSHALAAWRGVLDRRVALELGTVQLAAERADAGDHERLAAVVEAVDAAAGDWFAYRRADAAFHLALAETARSHALVTAMTGLQGELSDLLGRIGQRAGAIARANEQHRGLLEAVGRADAAGAVALMRAHLAGTEAIVAAALGGRNTFAASGAPA